MNVEKCEKC
jgi:hypothetical protein